MRNQVVRPLGHVLLALYTRVSIDAAHAHGRHAGPRHGPRQRDRGDVPGWVLVTIMTAGLVTALWLVADDKLKQLFNNALDGVVGNAP
jgi:hypothetical protein